MSQKCISSCLLAIFEYFIKYLKFFIFETILEETLYECESKNCKYVKPKCRLKKLWIKIWKHNFSTILDIFLQVKKNNWKAKNKFKKHALSTFELYENATHFYFKPVFMHFNKTFTLKKLEIFSPWYKSIISSSMPFRQFFVADELKV